MFGWACMMIMLKCVHLQENLVLKEQMGVLIKENNILKHAVKIQHERLADYDDKVLECQLLKQALSHCQEQVRSLEVRIYCLCSLYVLVSCIIGSKTFQIGLKLNYF